MRHFPLPEQGIEEISEKRYNGVNMWWGCFGMKISKKNFIPLVIFALLTLLFHLLADVKPLMNALAYGTLPLRQGLGRFCALFPFSVAEFLGTLGVLAVLAWLVWTVVSICRRKPWWKVLLKRLSLLLTVAAGLYFLLCIMLGASLRADGFRERSGLKTQPEPTQALKDACALFAARLWETADTVPRGEIGTFTEDVDRLFDDAAEIYRGAEKIFPILQMEDVRPKQAFYSVLMSRLNFTGYYFPYMGEATVNVDVPVCLLPATIAHEMAHQRGVAAEQEANFVAVLACVESGNPEYAYSGWLFGFIHLVNALYKADTQAYYEVASLAPPAAWADIQENNDYWARFETKEAEVTEKVYDSMLKSYGQPLGVQSYGAVADLLIAWYLQGGFGTIEASS